MQKLNKKSVSAVSHVFACTDAYYKKKIFVGKFVLTGMVVAHIIYTNSYFAWYQIDKFRHIFLIGEKSEKIATGVK